MNDYATATEEEQKGAQVTLEVRDALVKALTMYDAVNPGRLNEVTLASGVRYFVSDIAKVHTKTGDVLKEMMRNWASAPSHPGRDVG